MKPWPRWGRIGPVGEATGRSYARESVANDESPIGREDLGLGNARSFCMKDDPKRSYAREGVANFDDFSSLLRTSWRMSA